MTAEASEGPDVSVVIPTHGRETRLAFALEALAQQTLARERFEVIVVRGPDSPGPHAPAPPGVNVRFLTAPAVGVTMQRNAAWPAARARLVAFTDDDCRPAPQWLERLVQAADADRAILQGRTEPDPDEAHLLYGLARSKEVRGPNEWYATCNIAYPRALLEELGGFDESFRLSGEDVDLGLRAREAQATVRFVDEALVWHAVHSRSLPHAIRESLRREDFARIIARHPAQRRAIWARLFVNERHAAVALLAGAAIAARRPGPAILGALPYLALNLAGLHSGGSVTPRRLARHVVHLPARLAVDLVELGATVKGAIRCRVAVL